MKTLLLPTLLLTLPLALSAEDTSPNATKPAAEAPAADTTKSRADGLMHAPDGIVKVQGAIKFLKSGKLSMVNSEMKLSEGLTVTPEGKVTLKDGKTIMLEEGQMVGLDGTLQHAPKGMGSTAPGSASEPRRETGAATDFGQSGLNKPQRMEGSAR